MPLAINVLYNLQQRPLCKCMYGPIAFQSMTDCEPWNSLVKSLACNLLETIRKCFKGGSTPHLIYWTFELADIICLDNSSPRTHWQSANYYGSGSIKPWQTKVIAGESCRLLHISLTAATAGEMGYYMMPFWMKCNTWSQVLQNGRRCLNKGINQFQNT